MKILVVTNMYPEPDAPVRGSFVQEQVESLRARGHTVPVLHLRTRGSRRRYLTGVGAVIAAVARHRPQVVHAHYGLTALVAAAAPGVPVVATYHGSDVMIPWQRRISALAARRARVNICVSEGLARTLAARRARVLPCGTDSRLFRPLDRTEALERLGWSPGPRRVLFPGARANAVKDWPLFHRSVARIERAEAVPLEGYGREEVPWVMAACDAMALTSRHEGSPMVVKEALACGLPVISVPVGDVPERLEGLEGCKVVPREPNRIAEALIGVLSTPTGVRRSLLPPELTLGAVAEQLERIYHEASGSGTFVDPPRNAVLGG